MSNEPEAPSADRSDDSDRHPTELERAVRASVVGVALGVFLRLVSRRRSA